MKSARELMTANPITIPSFKTLKEGLDTLFDLGISSVPVVDNFGEPLGLLSEFALVRAYLKFHNSEDKSKNQIFHFKELLEPISIIQETLSVSDTIKSVFANSFHRVLVKNGSGKLVGVVSPKDILKVLSGDQNHLSQLEVELNTTKADLRKLAGQLKDNEEITLRYHSYLEEAPFNFHSLNEEGKVIFANRSLRETLGYTSDELIGMPLDALYTPDQVDKAREGLKSIMKSGTHLPIITTFRCKDGTSLRVEALSSALIGSEGQFIATVTMSRRMASDNMLRALNGVLDISEAKPFE